MTVATKPITPMQRIEPSEHVPAKDLLAPETNFRSMMEFAKTIVDSGLMPKHVNTPGKAVAIILTGREMGIGPMQAMRSISIVEGKPTLAADLQLALFHKAGGKTQFTALDASKGVLVFHAPWLVKPHTETFTIEDAGRANLTNKDVWKKYPKAMLRSRVITAGLKSIGFEPTTGAYDPEELDQLPVISGDDIQDAEIVQHDDDGVAAPTSDAKVDFGPESWRGRTLKELKRNQLEFILGVGFDVGQHTNAWRRLAQAELDSRPILKKGEATAAAAPANPMDSMPEGIDDVDNDDPFNFPAATLNASAGAILKQCEADGPEKNRKSVSKAALRFNLDDADLRAILKRETGQDMVRGVEKAEDFARILVAIAQVAAERDAEAK
jgi:hypothetical protein